MARGNIFAGETNKARFARLVYEHMMKKKDFTYDDILKKFHGEKGILKDKNNRPANYCDLKKAFRAVRETLKAELGNDYIEEAGNNKNRSYRYTGPDDPLLNLRNATVVNQLTNYWQFCQDSYGFFPKSWMEYFFENTTDLIDIKKKSQKGEACMMASVDRKLDNIERLPVIYEKIKSKTVIKFKYFHRNTSESSDRTVHPQFLHEYNGRWQLLGYEEGEGKRYPAQIALDGIRGDIADCKDIEYKSAEPGFYQEFFKDIVGPTRTLLKSEKPESWEDNIKKVRIRAYGEYMYELMRTKPLHSSQKPVEGGYSKENGYGDFTLDVIVNMEFIGCVLHYGAGIEVVEPREVRDLFTARVKTLSDRYK